MKSQGWKAVIAAAVCLASITPTAAMAAPHHHDKQGVVSVPAGVQGNGQQRAKKDGSKEKKHEGHNVTPNQVLNQLSNFLNEASSDGTGGVTATDRANLKVAMKQFQIDERSVRQDEVAFVKAVRQYEHVITLAQRYRDSAVLQTGVQGGEQILTQLKQVLPTTAVKTSAGTSGTAGPTTAAPGTTTSGTTAAQARIQARITAIQTRDKQVLAIGAALQTATSAFATLTSNLAAQLKQSVTGSVYGNQGTNSNVTVSIKIGDL